MYVPLLTAWLSSSFALAVSGATMAIRYRASDKPRRDAFVGSSNSILLTSWVTWWASPCFPHYLSSQILLVALTAPMIIFGVYNSVQTARDADEIITGRRDVKAKETAKISNNRNLLWWRDFIIYVVQATYGLPFFMISSLAVITIDRPSSLSVCNLMIFSPCSFISTLESLSTLPLRIYALCCVTED